MLKIKDNLLKRDEFEKIQQFFMSGQVPWQYGSILEEHLRKVDPLDNYQFSTIMYWDNQPVSPAFKVIYPVLREINMAGLAKVKANCNPRASKVMEHGFHTDVPFKCKTGIFYLNTNDGYTRLEDGTMIESIENRLIIFDSETRHTGTTCTNQTRRLVLNINYFDYVEHENQNTRESLIRDGYVFTK